MNAFFQLLNKPLAAQQQPAGLNDLNHHAQQAEDGMAPSASCSTTTSSTTMMGGIWRLADMLASGENGSGGGNQLLRTALGVGFWHS
jgi:hypothetical protein